ncbi:hypothetical protein RF11_15298 [Thelohanellus kitauei]|uniref:Uncharacterized protein n=1 Tax=Thelohanellus kitauei TaxID=669202 RepID=A0A0C2IV23_THEKT|nr:hypothetical protein RF11_15298 [Thelohanellus kitauei]
MAAPHPLTWTLLRNHSTLLPIDDTFLASTVGYQCAAKRHPFSGPVNSVRPQPHCHNLPTPFMVSVGRDLGTLTRLSVHPASPVLLTKNGPLETHAFSLTASTIQSRNR